MIPMVEMDTIGAGGGSIAYVDAGGIFRGGPAQRGSRSGPACYGRGGEEPAATRSPARARPDPGEGACSADGCRSTRRRPVHAIETNLCRRLGITVEEAALAGAQDPDAHDGAGDRGELGPAGLRPARLRARRLRRRRTAYACDIAQELEIPQVVVPPHPGITSAMGLLATNVAYDYVKTEMAPLHETNPERLEADFGELEAQAAAQLARDGFTGDSALLERSADCRYVGQGYELRIPLPPGPVDATWIERVRETFHDQHERRYYRRYDEAPIQVVNIHAVGAGAARADARTGRGRRGPEPPRRQPARRRSRSSSGASRRGSATRHYDRALLEERARGRRAGDRPPVRLHDHRQSRARRPCRCGREPAGRLLQRSRHGSDPARGPTRRRRQGPSPSSTR